MSKVDLNTHKAALAAARDAVLADQSAGRYAVFGYADSGQSNALAVEEEAEQGGLEDLVAEFNSGRYQYGLAGVETSKGVKYVLLIWQGEGTPILRKSACAHHAAEVCKFMNVTTSVTARSEEELEPDLIAAQLDKGSKY